MPSTLTSSVTALALHVQCELNPRPHLLFRHSRLHMGAEVQKVDILLPPKASQTPDFYTIKHKLPLYLMAVPGKKRNQERNQGKLVAG